MVPRYMMCWLAMTLASCGAPKATPKAKAETASVFSAPCKATEKGWRDEREVDFVRQIATISNMHYIATLAGVVMSEGKELTEENLMRVGPLKDRTCDGWGRPLAFFARHDRYVLTSFGRNGTPDPPKPWTGNYTVDSVTDYDSDIVVAGTAQNPWLPVQTPWGVDL